MMSIPLGPLALPTVPLLLLMSTLLAAWLADRIAERTAAATGVRTALRTQASAGAELMHAVFIGLLIARLAQVVAHHPAYLESIWSVLDLRDGGWNPWAGLMAGLLWLFWRAWLQAQWRKALAAGAVAGLLLWAAGLSGLAALVPRELPELSFTELATGRPVSLQEFAGRRPLVISLWASWCGPCRRELPILADAQARYPGVLFIYVNQGESATTVRQFLSEQNLELTPVLLDPHRGLGPALGSAGLPTTVFYDRLGRRKEAHMGALNAAALDAKLAAITHHEGPARP